MRKIFALALLVLAPAAPAAAQGVLPIALEARGALAFPIADFPLGRSGMTADTEMGVGIGVNGSFAFFPGVAVYGGWDRYAFGVDDDSLLGAGEAEFVDQGFAVGGKLSLPLGMLVGASPWIRAGALFRTLERPGEQGTVGLGAEGRSSRSVGYELGAGATIPLGLVLSFTPGVTYRSYTPDFGHGSERRVKYVDVSMGLRASL